jgi:HD-like signal output (HDOD) protein
MQDSTADKTGDALKAQRFQMLEDIARELAGPVVFPTYFDAAFRLRKELQNPELPVARMATIVSLEPLVASKLMQLAGSVLYSPDGTPPRNLQAAIGRLGVELVKTTALAIAMNQLLRSKDVVLFSELTRTLWEHTLKTAAAARVLARAHTRINPDEALLAGLVHDLGAFYMLYRVAQYPELRSRPDTVRHLIIQWHEGIGVSLLSALGMPEGIVDATIDHDQPRLLQETVRTLGEVLYVANILGGAESGWIPSDSPEQVQQEALLRAQYSTLLPDVEADARVMQSVFS